MNDSSARLGSAVVAVGGALVAMFLFYVFFRLNGGLTAYDMFTGDQNRRLGMEGLVLLPAYYGSLVFGGALALWLVLRRADQRGAGMTAGLYIVLITAAIALIAIVVPITPDAPIVAPYLNYVGVALSGLLARSIVSARLERASNEPAIT